MKSCQSAKMMAGRLALITGASSGLGREVAFQLAKRQTDVVLACRDRNKGEKALSYVADRLQKSVGDSAGKLYLMDLDLSDLRSISSFAEKFRSQFDSLHLLINNAGLMASPYAKSRGDQIEMQFAVNHLGHFHLTNLLSDMLQRSSPSRILLVSSGYYRKTCPPKDGDWTGLFARVARPESDYDPLKAYARSKLANCLHGLALAKRLPESVRVCVIRPGFVRGTELGRHFNAVLRVLATPLTWAFSQTVEQGAQTYLHCALADELPAKSGSMFYNCQPQAYESALVNEVAADALWTLSEELVEEESRRLEQVS